MPEQPKIVPFVGKHHKAPRRKTTERGYGSSHQKLRAAILAAYPVCQLCEDAAATDLHHINERTEDQRRENLLAVCESCHHKRIHGRG